MPSNIGIKNVNGMTVHKEELWFRLEKLLLGSSKIGFIRDSFNIRVVLW
jgi:hypothetical protein